MLIIPFCGYQEFSSWAEYSFGGIIPNSTTTYKSRVEGFSLIVGDWLGIAFEDIHYTTNMVVFGGEDHAIWTGTTDLWPNSVCKQWMKDIHQPVLVQDGRRWIQCDEVPEPLQSSMINCDCLNRICYDIKASKGLNRLNLNYFRYINAQNYGPWDIEGIYRDSIQYYNSTPPEYPWERYVVTSRPHNDDDDYDNYYRSIIR